jgi:hypothetical protein
MALLRLSGARLLASALRSAQQQASATTIAAASTAGRRTFSSIEGTFGDKERAEEVRKELQLCPNAHHQSSPLSSIQTRPLATLPAVSFPCSSAPSSRRHSRLPIRASALAGGAISPSKRDGFHSQHFVIILRGRQTFFFFFLPSQPRPPTQNATQLIPAQRIHFRKEDERLLRKLLAKVKAQADTVS